MIEKIGSEKLFDNPFVGIVVVSPKGEIVKQNPKMSSMTGYIDDELRGLCLDSLVHEDYKEDLYANCKHMPGQRRNVSGVFIKFLKKDQSYEDFIINISNISDDKGQIKGHVLYFEQYTGESLSRSYVDDNGDTKWIAIQDKDQKEEFLCNIFHGIQDSIIIMDVSGNIISYNIKAMELLDVTFEQISEIGNLSNISPDDGNMKAVEKFLMDAYSGTDQSFTWQLKKPFRKEVIDVEVFVTKINKMGEDVILATIRDVTDKKKIEDDLKNSELRYRQLVEHSPDGIIIHKKGTIRYVNPAATVILGGDEEEDLLGTEVVSYFTEDKQEFIKDRLKDLYENNISMPLMEAEMLKLDKTLISVEFAAMPFNYDGDTAVQVVLRDITEKKKHEQYIRYLALHDKLTGLANRELLSDRINSAAERRKRDDQKNAIIYLDLDGFKPINDTMGHDAGDEALIEIGRRIEDAIRGSDTAARIGGDEFVVLLEGVKANQEISTIAGRIIESINAPLRVDSKVFHVGASMGISVYPDNTSDHGELLTMADKAMYHVKDTGKNRFAYFSEVFS